MTEHSAAYVAARVRVLCGGCGAGGTLLTDQEVEQGWHVLSEHDPSCDGSELRCLETCPVAVQCGPVQRVG